MNLICSIFLTFFVVFRPLVPLVDYAVNYHYISQELCENKELPNLHCNGKCYLAKELAKSNDTESSPLHKTKTSVQKAIDIFISTEITAVPAVEKVSFFESNFHYRANYTFQFLRAVFRPPHF